MTLKCILYFYRQYFKHLKYLRLIFYSVNKEITVMLSFNNSILEKNILAFNSNLPVNRKQSSKNIFKEFYFFKCFLFKALLIIVKIYVSKF